MMTLYLSCHHIFWHSSFRGRLGAEIYYYYVYKRKRLNHTRLHRAKTLCLNTAQYIILCRKWNKFIIRTILSPIINELDDDNTVKIKRILHYRYMRLREMRKKGMSLDENKIVINFTYSYILVFPRTTHWSRSIDDVYRFDLVLSI